MDVGGGCGCGCGCVCVFCFVLDKLMFPVSPSWDGNEAGKMCITADSVSVSVLVVVSMTDGAADSGELDLSGIDDSEIELVR